MTFFEAMRRRYPITLEALERRLAVRIMGPLQGSVHNWAMTAGQRSRMRELLRAILGPRR